MSSAPDAPIQDGFFLRVDDPDQLTTYLRQRGWMAPGEAIQALSPAGDGNMNCTIRVVTSARRLVVKQGRPWVERYPSIPAPAGRTLVEAAFYETVAAVPAVAGRMPALVGVDREHRVLVMDDCVGFADVTGVYSGGTLDPAVLDTLLAYLAALHRLPVGDPAVIPFSNEPMQALNHAYIFALPLVCDADASLRLDGITPGLSRLAERLSAEAVYSDAVARLGQRYLHGAPRALVHGDFFPGSWLARDRDVVVIDPEFCFAGAPEFDYGVMAAHLMLAGQDDELVRRITGAALAQGLEADLVAGFAGVEVMRRLIGVAQLPKLSLPLAAKAALLDRSRRLVLGN
ncbi:MAG TPA: phosphotransferase [Vicinamibacterales bacterium]|nr:phosphotransferase [Vicinamibacterales bacterium]